MSDMSEGRRTGRGVRGEAAAGLEKKQKARYGGTPKYRGRVASGVEKEGYV